MKSLWTTFLIERILNLPQKISFPLFLVNLSQENRSEASEFDGTEESSDDETDPPPPVCTTAIPQPSAQITASSCTPMPQTTAVGSLPSSSATLSLINKSSSLTAASCLPSVSSRYVRFIDVPEI